ncbi:MAG: WD40/YVTN/BNR-like repeat-containing protein, partial [Lysobacterales bacterium]
TDDGNVWVTSGGGNDWRNVSARLPDQWVSRVVASAHFTKRAYLSLNAYRNDDASAMVYVTDDLGASWRSIASNLPAEAVNVIREDPVNPDLLYVGSDRGVYVSLDRGGHWQAFGEGLPNVPVHDLIVHPRDRELVAATHGRSVWVADVLPVQELNAKVQAEPAHLFYVDEIQASRDWRSRASRWFDETPYLPERTISYWAAADGQGQLSVLDNDQRPLRTIPVNARRGLNSLVWDLQVDQTLALAAESVSNAAAAAKAATPEVASASGDPATATASADAPADPGNGQLAKTPYAEAVRLGQRLYLVPGDYRLKLDLNGASSETAFKVKAPEAFKPRAKPRPKLRGRDD